MLNKKFQHSILASSLTATLLLSACGGGGGGDGNNAQAAITGTTTGAITSGTSEVTGTITVTDSDAGQATFVQPTSLAGTYGTWTFVISGNTATWRYTLTTAPSAAATETLSIRSQDGSATQNITVSIAAGGSASSALVTTVPAPVYSGTYAAEKVAVFNRLNDDRSRCGFGKLAQNSKLDLAAQNHAVYLASNGVISHNENQNLTGFTGSDVAARFSYVGYGYASGTEIINGLTWGTGTLGNSTNNSVNISELGATNSLKHLYSSIYHLAGAMSQDREIGIGIDNKPTNSDGTFNLKPLVVNLGIPFGASRQSISTSDISTFPCNGTVGLSPVFGAEDPDPFPNVNRDLTPYGQPIYVTSGPNTTITLSSGTVTLRGGAVVPTTTLTSTNDPQSRLQANQVFLVPTARLADNSTYDVSMSGTSTGLVSTSNPTGAWNKSFSFTTGTVLSE